MSKTSNPLEQHKLPTGGNFGFSATKVEDLGATEFTLVTLVNDVSGSVGSYKDDMCETNANIIEACAKSPRSENLMARMVAFDTIAYEQHGFKTLDDCDPADYKAGGSQELKIGGATALFDASVNAIAATGAYAKNLSDSDFDTNAIVFIVTDGWDNSSSHTADDVKKALEQIRRDECLESIMVVLIGVGVDSGSGSALDQFRADADLTQYVELPDASPTQLAKLADFISKSVSSQSQALGTGGPSQPLTL